MRRICVFCGSNAGHDPRYRAEAEQLGRLLAGRGIELVYGAGNVGLMGAIADACLAVGGTVIGVIPEALVGKEVAGRHVDHRELVDVGGPVVQFHAVAQLLAHPARHGALHRGQVGLGHLVRRVHQPVRELAVVGEQQQPLGVGVETTDVEQVLVAAHAVFDQVADARAALLVGHGRHHPQRLVQRQIHQVLIEQHPGTVDADHRVGRIHPRTQLRHDPAVDLDETAPCDPAAHAEDSFRAAKERMVQNFERTYIQQLLASSGGNVTHAARAAQKNRRAFFELMRKYRIEPEHYRGAGFEP